MTRLQLFNRIALAVAYELQEGFPQISELNFSGLRLLSDLDADTRAACEGIFEESVVWLRDEGFLRFSDQSYDSSFYVVRLSEKGVSRLLTEAPHGVGENGKTLGTVLGEVGQSGLKAVTEGAVLGLIGAFLRGAT